MVRVGPTLRVRGNLDVYNALNGSAILGTNTTYGGQWLRPIAGSLAGNAIQDGRLIEFSGSISF